MEGLEGTPHNCVDVSQQQQTLRPHLTAEPIPDPDLTIYTDGCCYKGPDGLVSAYAVVQDVASDNEKTGQYVVLDARRLTGKQSAQRAELVGVLRALHQAKEQTVNIYTDSAYVCTIIHVALSEWLRTDFKTATGHPISHCDDVIELYEALMLPTKVAVIKCKGHSRSQDRVSQGNDAADKTAKETAGYEPQTQTQAVVTSEQELGNKDIFPQDNADIEQWQQSASPEEKTMWIEKGAQRVGQIWFRDGRPAIPQDKLVPLIREAHGPAHSGKKEVKRHLGRWWHPFMVDVINDTLSSCEI